MTSSPAPHSRSVSGKICAARFFARLCAALLVVALFVASPFASNARSQTSDAPKAASKATQSKQKNDELRAVSQFINENTLLVVRVNLQKVDYAKLGDAFNKVFAQLFATLGIPSESMEACLNEARQTNEALVANVREAIDNYQKLLGTQEIYYVLQSTKGEGACWIAPVEDLNPDQLEAVKSAFKKSGMNAALYQKNFVVASQKPLKEIGSYYKNFSPGPNATIEKYFNGEGADKTFAFYCGRIKIRPLVVQMFNLSPPNESSLSEEEEGEDRDAKADAPKSDRKKKSNADKRSNSADSLEKARALAARDPRLAGRDFDPDALANNGFGLFQQKRKKKAFDPFETAPRCVKDAVEIFDSSFVNASGSIDLSNLKVDFSMKFSAPSYANDFRENLSKMNNEYLPKLFETAEAALVQYSEGALSFNLGSQTLNQEGVEFLSKYRLLPIFREAVIAEIRHGLPKQEGDRLVYQNDLLTELQKIGPNAIEIAFLFDLVEKVGDNVEKLTNALGLKEEEVVVEPAPEEAAAEEAPQADEAASAPESQPTEQPAAQPTEPAAQPQTPPAPPAAAVPQSPSVQAPPATPSALPEDSDSLVDPRVDKLNQAKKKIGSTAGKITGGGK